MAVKFDVPASPKRNVFQINDFLGVDFTNNGTDIDERKSPNAPNMVRSVPSKVRKRMGYSLQHDFEVDTPIYGTHILRLNEENVDRVTNVNRALNTSPTSQIFTVTTAEFTLYELGSPFYSGQSVYYSFDYTLSSGSIELYLGTEVVELKAGTDLHYEGRADYFPASDTDTFTEIKTKLPDSSGIASTILEIKNFAIMYDMDNDYVYSKAPEDNEESFNIANIISIGEKNYSLIVGGSDKKTVSSSITDPYGYIDLVAIEDDAITEYTFAYIEFTVTATTTNTTDKTINIYSSYMNGGKYLIYSGVNITNLNIAQTVPTQINGYHLTGIELEFAHRLSYSDTFKVTYSNMRIRPAIPRTQFAIVSTVRLYHVGKKLYSEYLGVYTLLYSDMNEKRSSSWQIDSYIYIVDGKNYLRYTSGDLEATNIAKSGVGTIPLVTIARTPKGGGQSYNDRNLLQAGYEERFTGDGTSKQYQLSFFPLDSTAVRVQILQSDGTLSDMNEGDGFTVSRESGIVTFTTAPSTSPLTGEDNVYITAYRTAKGYSERISNCTIGTLYGVNGDTDRLFLSGNSLLPNYDWYSEISDPTYFADTSYSTLGSETSAIVGYSRVGNYLATHKDENELSQSVFVRVGEYKEESDSSGLSESSVVFKIVNTLQGAGAICRHGFGYLETEPLFLTREGIFAITSQDVTGEKYGQNRSFFLNGKLLEEQGLNDAYSINFKNYYILAINNKFYMLDGLQPLATDKSLPYATRQYVGFYCTDIPAYVLWEDNHELFFGTRNGKVYKFYSDENALESYNDDGEVISAWWETADLDGKLFYKNKTFRYLAVRLMSSLATSVKMWGKKHGIWSLLKEDVSSARYFAFSKLVFSKFTFSVDDSEKLAHTKVRVKKVDKARFKLENSEYNEPFGIYDFALEYIESGNYKG